MGTAARQGWIRATVVLLLGAVVGLGGCGWGEESADETATPATEEAKEVAIRVDDETVSMAEFNEKLDRQMQQFRQRMGGDTGEDAPMKGPMRQLRGQMKRRLANQMVQRLLITSHMKQAGITVSDSEVQARWQQLSQRFPSRESLQRTLRQQGTSETDVRSRIREKLKLQKYLDEEIGKIEVSDSEARQYFERNRSEYERPQQVRARHILVRDDTGAQERLDRVREALAGDSTFEEVARALSEGPSARKGGDLGYVSRDRMADAFAEAAFALDTGTISEPVKTRFGYHFIRVDDRRDTRPADFEASREEIDKAVRQEKQRGRWQELMRRLREESTVEVNVLDDTGPARGRMGPGQGQPRRGQQAPPPQQPPQGSP